MCLKLLPAWSSTSLDGIIVTKISGGISNLIVKVSPSEGDNLAPVAFKIFGEKTELLVDRGQELQTLIKLNAAGFGAQVSCVQSKHAIPSAGTPVETQSDPQCGPGVRTV